MANHTHSAFMRGSDELQTTSVERAQGGAFKSVSGLDNLVMLKTANSGFEGYIKDSLTTLPETKDRLFGTAVSAEWRYTSDGSTSMPLRRRSARRCSAPSPTTTANPCSRRSTLWPRAHSKRSLQIDEIEITMPNKHCLLVDLSRFGQDNPNEIFVPTDEPHGYIEARVVRKA